MAQRPTGVAKIARKVFSLVGGILLEFGFVFWFVIIVWGTAACALLLWQMVS